MMAKRAPRAGVRRALDQKQLVLFYQPIHEIDSRTIVSAEALLRARRRSGEIRSGVPLTITAEEGPDLFRLDAWTLQRAFCDASKWQAVAPHVRLNVNLSPREFQEGDVSRRLKTLAARCGAAPDKINVEITETSFIDKPKQAKRAIEALRDLGVELWLDDFGTGHSSISHLLQFPLDGLKVPESFVHAVATDPRCRAIIRAIVDLGHDLDMKVVAEGVERDDQLAFLREIGCDYIQGFLFSKPMPVHEFTRLAVSS